MHTLVTLELLKIVWSDTRFPWVNLVQSTLISPYFLILHYVSASIFKIQRVYGFEPLFWHELYQKYQTKYFFDCSFQTLNFEEVGFRINA